MACVSRDVVGQKVVSAIGTSDSSSMEETVQLLLATTPQLLQIGDTAQLKLIPENGTPTKNTYCHTNTEESTASE